MLSTYKVVRNDLLVASHLALDLVRDCLVLRMKTRDLEENQVRNTKGEINPGIELTAKGILDIIEQSAQEFDTLASQLDNAYKAKSRTLTKWIEEARNSISGEDA
jgi:hypothetical protein